MPSKVWIAIGRKDWTPRVEYPPLRIARISERDFEVGIETHQVEGTPVLVYGVAKTLADVFRYRRQVGTALAVEGLRSALKQRKATASEIAKYAAEAGVWTVMQPYLEALTLDV